MMLQLELSEEFKVLNFRLGPGMLWFRLWEFQVEVVIQGSFYCAIGPHGTGYS